MKVVCVSGHAGNGKDSAAWVLERIITNGGETAVIVHYADMLKFICSTFFGWNGEKDKYGRALLQYVGTEVFRAEDENYWVNLMLSILRAVAKENIWDYVIIADCRFPNEIDSMKKEFGAKHLRIVRPGYDNGLTPEQQAHFSETALDDYPVDILIDNSGTLLDLVNTIADIMKEI